MFRTAWFLTIVFLGSTAQAADVKIALWNGEELFDLNSVDDRAAELKLFADTVEPDILLIDEVCSIDVVEKVRKVMELDNYHVTCSDFNQRDNQRHGSFEVGIISRFPLDKVLEYDVTPDNRAYGRNGEPNEVELTADSLLKLGLDKASPGRGFLWARIDELQLTICLTHLKSSRSGDERENAMKREYVAAAMALNVLDDLEVFSEYSMIVAGDLNVGATDDSKNGKDLDEDVTSGNGDRYDETHALLGGGLVRGLQMTNLTKDVGETYDDTRFAGSGPIDNIYVTGENVSSFSTATKVNQTFGSDHFPVFVLYQAP